MIGAVVGVQPFGGDGLSGTGPKAGGPLYLLRLLAQRPDDAALQRAACAAAPRRRRVRGGRATPADAPRRCRRCATGPRQRAARRWRARANASRAVAPSRALARAARAHRRSEPLRAAAARGGAVPGRRTTTDRLLQLAAVLAVGSRALWPADAQRRWPSGCPTRLRERITLAQDWTRAAVHFDAVLHHGDAAARLRAVPAAGRARRADRRRRSRSMPGRRDIPLERLVVERALSINTAAAGGNASLMTIG